MWLKAVKAGNFIGWPLLTDKHITKYFPDTPETQQGHMAQTRNFHEAILTSLHVTQHSAPPGQEGV